ncbi:MAG: flagellar basal body rod protein FlgB [Spongiibacteraceae bacterium]|jgi:flagellar basal-body rod protein FlgB|nr:flagellar basal body rod protein FlgB [Spongiibacteraceae bacterium]
MGSINFKNALGIHEQALHFRARRAEVLANNLANANTPNYKARDVSFEALLAQQSASHTRSAEQPVRTDSRHMTLAGEGGADDLLYRVPNQPSIDGNTVEEHQEMARFARNSMDYEASFYFLSGKFRGLTNAIKGE